MQQIQELAKEEMTDFGPMLKAFGLKGRCSFINIGLTK